MSEETNVGAAALENMQLLQKESSVFKVPKVPKKKVVKKTNVLDEEEYVKGIAKIIQRDFFPDLEKLKAQNDFLEATENKDYAKLREIARKYSGQRPPTEPYNSPATFDTPHHGEQNILSEPPQIEIKEPPKDITDRHTLDSFLAKHTSEDNASYDRVISLENKKRAAKLSSQFEAEVTSAALVDSALAVPSIEEQADQTKRPEEIDTWRYRAKNYIMYVPDGAASQVPGPKPELQYENTRLKTQIFDPIKNKEEISAIARKQDLSVKGKIGVDGTTISSEKVDSQYPFVATPSPRPGDGPDQSPLMTWGEIEGTPFRLDGGDTPLPAVGSGAAYRMLEGGARERIAMKLAERAARRRRAPPTPAPSPLARPHTFRTNTERLESMSPAARKLAAKHLLLSPRLRLTPNAVGVLPHTTPKRTPTPRTPLVAPPRPPAPAPLDTPTDDITDNLLQINVSKRERLKAHDFFK
ncbi:splicing factor ESS-2 homolog [Aricia agestis]|uniref:splicing factor ESS-2 homolog n=1 Tax=Aricia agestis TaxID=91739 RepID=UPI001C201607|nr:splicing factor ESS-2 homolog [Aricia agestis]